MAFSTEKTLQKIRKYGSKSYVKEDKASAEERLEHYQGYYLDHEDEAREKYQAYLQQAQAEQAARDAQKQASQDYNNAMQFANRAVNPVVDRLARQAPYVNAEIRAPYQLEDEDPSAKAKELAHYEDVMSGRDANQKTLSRYETNRYIGIKKLDLSKDAQKALDDYKQGHDLIKAGTDTNVGNELAASALPDMYWDNSGKGQKDIDAGRKLEEDARKKLKAAGMSDEDITSWLGKDDDDYKNSMLGFQDDYALEKKQSKDIDREVNNSSAKGTWNRLYGTAMTSLGSPLMNVAKGVNAMTTRPAKKGLNTSRGYGTVADFDQFRQSTSNYYKNRYGKAGEFLYNAAASTMDSATNAATFGTLAGGLSNKLTTVLGATGKVKKAIDFGNAMLGSAGFAASSYADAYKDALDRGLDEKSARKTAIFNGAMEGITEAVSLDNVWDIAKTSGTKAARSALVDFLMQSGIEGSEEGAGDIADRIYDDLANGGMSEYNQNVRGYMQDGLSEKEAKSKANKDWWKQTGLDILAGSISGAVMGGGTHVLYSKASAEQAKATTSNFSPEDFGTLADNIDSESNGYTSNGAKKYLGDAAKAARDISNVMKNGQTPSNSLYAKLQESMDEAESIEADKREETKAQEKKNAANTPVEEDYHYRFRPDHPMLTPEEQQHQKAMQSAIQSGIDNANASDKYKIETTHLGDREGYQEMYNAANSSSTAENKLSTLGRVYNDMKHSADAGARANAESYYQLFTAQLGVSDEQAEQAKLTTQDAYLAGKRGDTQFAALNAEQKAAYNEGAQDYLKSRSASSVSDAENLRHAAVSLDSGAAKIDSIADIHTDNGERSVSVKLDNGKTVNLNDVQFSDRGAGVLYDYMSHLGTKGEMQSFLDNYSPDQQAGRYANAFREMYRSGALDTAQGKADFDKAYKALPESYRVMFGKDQLRSIYNSGANETSEQYIQDMENQRKTVARKGTGRLYIRDEGHNLQEIADDNNSKAYMPLLRAYAAATKTDIIVADDIDDNINGMYDSAMQRIVLNANNESALYNTVFHEGVGEVLQAYNAKGAQKVRSVLLQYVADTKGRKYVQNIAQKYQNAYTPVEATKSYSDAVGEAMNDAISGIFSTKEGIHDFEQWMEKKEGAKKTQNVLEKLADHFKDVAESMRNLLNSGKLSKPAEDVATMAEKRASKVRKMILDELDVAIKNAQNATLDKNAKSTAAYSIKAGMTDEQRYNELQNIPDQFANTTKSLTENIPTKAKFSIDVDQPVQQTKDLIAVHNLDEADNVKDQDFSYDTLAQKDDISIPPYYGVRIDDKEIKVKTLPRDASRSLITDTTRENIKIYNDALGREQYGDQYLYNKDIGAVVSIGNRALKHDMRRGELAVNAHTALPLYFENAIVINIANGSEERGNDFSYVLAGAFQDEDGTHVCMINVSHRNGGYYADINGIKDKLYSLNEGKNNRSAVSNDTHHLDKPLDEYAPKITVSQLLEMVNNSSVKDELSTDVLDHFGSVRGSKPAISNLRYSLNIDDDLDAVFDEDLDAPFVSLKESSIRGEDVLKEGEEALGSIHVPAADTYRLAQKIVSDYGLSGQTRALNSDLQKVFAYMEKNKGNLNTRVLNGVIHDLARPYIDSITETVGSGEYDDIMSSLGKYEVSLTDKQLAEVKSAFGSLSKFKSVVKGSIRINQNANTNLDQAWAGICDSVPGQLDVDTAEGNEPLAIADLIDAARPVQKSAFEGETADEMAQDMSLAIMKSYYDYASKNAVNKQVQKKAAKVSARLQKKQTDMRAKMRARYNERLIKARKDLRKHFNDRITDIRQKNAEKLDATKKAMRDQQTIRLGELKAADLEKMAALKAKNKKKWQAAAEARKSLHERQQIDKHWTSLFNMLDNPTDNKHIPKALRRIVMDLLDSIDQDHPYIRMTADGKYRLRVLDHIDENGKYIYQTKDFDTRENAILAYRAAIKLGMGSRTSKDWQAMMSRLDDLYRAAENGAENDDALNDFVRNLDPDIAEDFHEIVSNKDAVSTALLSSEQLHTINRVLRNVESAVNQYNRMITDNTAEIASIAEPIIDHAHKVRGRKDHTRPVTIALDFVSLDNATPDTFFTGMGDGGQKLYKMLLNAMDTKTHDIRQASEYMYGNGSKANGAYTSGVLAGVNLRELNSEWTGAHATVHNFESATGKEVASEGSDTVSMTTAQVMSLYELSKRQQAMLHTQGGIRVDAINGKHQDVRYLTPDAIETITSTLTKEQKSAADAMQKFMAVQAAKWGNAASNKMFGYDKFTEEHYFPITTDKTTVRTNNNSVNNEMINSIRNMGMTKQVVPGADNPIVIKDIFDVFAGHINDMATYHAYAPAIQDLIRVYDYKVKEDIPGGFVQSTTVKNAIQKLYGDSGNKYMVNLVKSLNNAEKSNYTITNWGLLGKNYRAAAVSGNLRVVMQQPMAWFRAGMEVDYKYLNKGLLPNADADRMREETSDMYWAKSQGNVDGIVTKGFKQQITGAESTKDKLVNMSMALAGKADDVTWAALYRGVFAEQKAAFEKAGKAVQNNGEYTKAFTDAVNSRFDDMISRTQVIDGTLFRSNIMRSNDGLVQFMTSFMAEPTKTYNMFLREAMNMSQNGASKEAMKRVAKAAVVFTITQLATALAQSIPDAFRRDDDDQKWYEVFLDAYMGNLRDNMNVFQLLPGVKDVWSMIENAFSDENYSSSGFYEQQSISTLIDTVQQDIKYINNARNGEDQSKTRYGIFMSNMRALANFTGIPIYNMSRTAAEIYNEMNDLWGGENLYKTTKARKAHYKNVLIEAVENNDDVEKALQDYIDAGGKASSAISTEQKNAMKQEYIDAYNAEDTKTMKRIEESTSPIFEAERKAKQEKAKENGEKVPEDFNPDEYYNKWVAKDAKQTIYDSIDKGSDYRKAIERTLKYGMTYQSIESAITSQYKNKYLQMYQKDRGSVTKLKNRLDMVYKYLDQKEGQKKPSKRKWLDDPAKYLKEQKK